MPYIKRNYGMFQHINYYLPTGYPRAFQEEYTLNLTGLNNTRYTTNNYLNVPNNLNGDITRRLKNLAGAVHLANMRVLQEGTSSQILKVFTLPEFFFRPATGENNEKSYSKTDKDTLIQALRGMFTHPDFTDWLFVLGTVIWNARVGEIFPAYRESLSWIQSKKSENQNSMNQMVVFNTAIVLKGGSTEAPLHMTDKINYADCDNIKTNPPSKRTYRSVNCKAILNSWKVRKRGLFQIDNLRLGIEICKDHDTYFHILKSTYNDLVKYDKEKGQRQPHLHLVVAAATQGTVTSATSKVGGYVLRADSSRPPYAQIFQVKRQNVKDVLLLDASLRNDISLTNFKEQHKGNLTEWDEKGSSNSQGDYTEVTIPNSLKYRVQNYHNMQWEYKGNLMISRYSFPII